MTLLDRFWPKRLRRQWRVSVYEPWSASQRRRIGALIGAEIPEGDGRTPIGDDFYFWSKDSAEQFATRARYEFDRTAEANTRTVEVVVERRFDVPAEG